MKRKFTFVFLVLILVSFNLFAHKDGHGHSTQKWRINNEAVFADYVKYEDDTVFLMNANHELLSYQLSSLTPKDQKWVLAKYQQVSTADQSPHNPEADSSEDSQTSLWYLLGGSLVLLSLIFFMARRRKII